jgi:hypothetical protein
MLIANDTRVQALILATMRDDLGGESSVETLTRSLATYLGCDPYCAHCESRVVLAARQLAALGRVQQTEHASYAPLSRYRLLRQSE